MWLLAANRLASLCTITLRYGHEIIGTTWRRGEGEH